MKRVNTLNGMKHISCLLAITVLTAISTQAQAPVDGFYKGAGAKEVGIGAGMNLSDTYLAGTREISLTRNTVAASVFGIIGLVDGLDLSAAIPFVSVNSEAGLQDASIYLKYRVYEAKMSTAALSFSAAAGFSTNLTDYETESGSSIGQQAQVLDFRPIIHYQHNSGWFSTAQFAYLLKSDPTPNAINAALKVGKASANHYYDVWYTHQTSDGGLNYLGCPEPESFKELGTDFHKVGVTYYRPISDKLGMFAGGDYLISGRNISIAYGLNLGAVFKL